MFNLKRPIALILTFFVAGCAANSGGGLLARSTRTFQGNGATITVGFMNSLGGCVPTTGMIENKKATPLGYVYAQLMASTADGRTVGAWSVNFPPTISGGSAQAAAITGDGGAGVPCEALQFHMNA